MTSYKLIDHTADIAIEVQGDDLKSLFVNCGLALFDILYEVNGVRALNSYEITATGGDVETLLINFLRELFFQFEIDKIMFKEVYIKNFADNEVTAIAKGEEYDENRHRLRTEIKAVTYHDATITREGGKLKVSIVLDT